MKFSIRDWCFAVSYSKNYEDDYKNYQKKSLPDYPEYFLEDGVDKHSRLSEPAQILCDKWGIDFPIRPIKYGDSFPSDDILLSFVNPIKPLPAKEKWKQIEGFAFGKEWQQILKINRKTVLSIDPRFPIDIILKKIKEYLEVNVYSSDGRIRNNELDHWLIFHQY
ncbi:MAG: hypothetical protein K9K64_02655, partial [Desulfohalobiaceae bacterium]|nr:hypothetical protein [Desulfohalobiaceae bacterium]